MMIKVLYVDDEPRALDIAKTFMEESGDLSVDTATSVKAAMELMATTRYDVIISDYMMPGIDGLQYLDMVRERDLNMPFILFTGRGREEVIIDACNSGVSFYVQKGNDVEAQFVELEHKVRQAAARRAVDEGLRTRNIQANMAMGLAQIASWEYDTRTGMFGFDDIFYHLYRTDARREGGYQLSPEKYLQEFVHPDDVARVAEFMSKGLDNVPSDGYLQIEHRIVRRDGEVRKLVVRVGKMVDADGNVLKVVGISQDVTDR